MSKKDVFPFKVKIFLEDINIISEKSKNEFNLEVIK